MHRLCVGIATAGFVLAASIPDRVASIVGFLLVGIGVATFMLKLYDDAARLPGRRAQAWGR